MIVGKRKAARGAAWMALVLVLVSGCASSGPEVGDAESAFEEGEYEVALSRIEEALERDSSNTAAYLLRAKVLRRMADTSLAPDEYKALHRRAREAEEAALPFKSSLQKRVSDTWEEVYRQELDRGEEAYNRGNKNEDPTLYRYAISFFGAAGMVRPDSARPVLNEGFARLRVGQEDEAIPVLEEYVARADTADRAAYKILGQLYTRNEQFGKAVSLLGEAARLYPEDQKFQVLRLNAYNQLGNVDEALAAYREQIETQPEEASYRYNYGALLLKAKRYDDAIEQLERATDLHPDHARGQYNLGAAYVNAALARDDSIAVLEEDEALSDSIDVEGRIDALADQRRSFFERAVPPLERARKMEEATEAVRQDACRALMVAYVQTNRPNRAAKVEECTDFAQAEF